MKKILVFKGWSQYDVMRYWMDELVIGFEKIDVEVVVLDIKYIHSTHWEHYINNSLDAIISFNGIMLELRPLKDFIDQLGIPFIMLLADHPVDHIERIQALIDKDILMIVDRNDRVFIDRLHPATDNVFMLPHAALEVPYIDVEKKVDLLFAGTYSEPSESDVNWRASPKIKTMVEETIHHCLLHPKMDYLQYFLKQFEKIGMVINDELIQGLHSVYTYIGRYLYSVRRVKVIEEIGRSGIALHIYGNGWKEANFSHYSNITFHEPLSFWGISNKIAEAKLSLNIAGIANDGTHERVFTSMANGSVCVTNHTNYLEELFEPGKEILFYNLDGFSQIVPQLQELLIDERRRTEIALKAKRKVATYHTFQNRALEIKQIFADVHG